jgi:molybdenum cofactor biosynthesis protein B
MAVPREHKAHAPRSVKCAVVTISDSRTEASDDTGRLLKDLLLRAGHTVLYYAVVKDDPKGIADAVEQASWTCEAILTNGGTGVGKRDVTIPTLAPLMERTLPGFGELFRARSFDAIGSAAFLSGATAGVYHGRFLACLPGSPDACRLALEALLLPELGHIVGLLAR